MKSTMDKTHKAGPRENKGIAGNMLITQSELGELRVRICT
jgi:hypothetical protein